MKETVKFFTELKQPKFTLSNSSMNVKQVCIAM